MIQTMPLSELQHGQHADFFAQLFKKERALTRQGRPYYSLEFRDARRNVAAVIWEGTPHELPCRDQWTVGRFYKIRGRFSETTLGGKIEISMLREVGDDGHEAGFDPLLCQPVSADDPQELFDELLNVIDQEITIPDLHQLVTTIYQTHRERLAGMPGAMRHHHAYAGGFLEHVYSVTRNVLYLLNTYRGLHASLRDTLTRELAIAGALLHDIGKLWELDEEVANTAYTIPGELIGHILLGRDLVRDTARELEVDGPWLLRLEHLVVSHQGGPDHGSPKSPMTWEANLVYWADQLDGNMFRLASAMEQEGDHGSFLPRSNPFGRRVFRGELPTESETSA
ncbi:3'-5' exoribonuclease YhaM family protein [Bremerella cremea]|uniref:3'-5' exoribonuclease YhaM family protein n=1 Tax=Bremerella cremea TaxID=1031537 RepID=UPI0031E6DA71